MDRKQFLADGLSSLLRTMYEFAVAEDEETAKPQADYFQSFSSCYPILAECSLKDLQIAARQKGIDPEGKTKFELAQILFGNGARP